MQAKPNWDAYNQFLNVGTLDRFTKLLARHELYQRVVSLPGDVVEAGVFKGAGLLYWARLIQIFNGSSGRRVIGFDTFEGYPGALRPEERATATRFEADAQFEPVTVEQLTGAAAGLGLAHRVELVKGDAVVSVPQYAASNPGFRVALLNLDFDTYESTLVCLKQLYPLVVPGGIVAFDDYGVRGWGESDAADEFVRECDASLESLPWALSPTAYFVKPR